MEKNKPDHDAEKRFNSVRSLPHGQFNKYRQMFDSLTKRKDKSSSLQKAQKSASKPIFPEAQTNSNNFIITQDRSHVEASPIRFVSNIRPIFEDEQELENLISNLSIYKTKKEDSKIDMKNKSFLCNKENFEIEMDKIFDGVSDETNLLLNSLCTSNQQIADFFEKSESSSSKQNSSSNSNSNQLIDTSTSSFLSESSSVSSSLSSIDVRKRISSLPNQSHSINIYTVIPINSTSDIENEQSRRSSRQDITNITSLTPSTDNSFSSLSLRSISNCNKQLSKTIQEPNESIITYSIDHEKDDVLDKEMNKKTISETSSTSSLSSTSSISNNKRFKTNLTSDNEALLMTTTLSTIEHNYDQNYLEIDDVDFSDESYYEEDLYKQPKTVKFASPPPKPARTFEHDIYVQTKELIKSKKFSGSCILSSGFGVVEDEKENRTKSLYCPSDHVYETLHSVKHLDLECHDFENSKKFIKNLNSNNKAKKHVILIILLKLNIWLIVNDISIFHWI